jgi:hypothetical protein
MVDTERVGRIRDFPHERRGKPEAEFRSGPDCAGGDKADTDP